MTSTSPWCALVALLFVSSCTAERVPQETGALMLIVAPASLRDSIAAVRVRVHSGDRDADNATWPERGDETADVEEWPAEIFVHGTDHTRGWYADVWGLDEDGEALAFAQAGGKFEANTVRRWVVTLDACDSCDAPEPPEADAGVGDEDASTEIAMDAGRDGGPRDGGQPRDATSSVQDAAPQDASPHDARAEPGTAVMCGANLCEASACPASMPSPCCTGTSSTCGCFNGAPPCVDRRDAGEPHDTGTPPGGAQVCATTPAFATPDACTRCICMRCATQVASCYGGSLAAHCAPVRDCSIANRCSGTNCYCGDSLLCLAPNGPCLQQTETAAGTNDVTQIQMLSEDPATPLGASNAVGICSMSSCAAECGL